MSWRRLRTLLQREVRATYRDPFTMATLVSVPIVGLLLFGFILTTEVKHLAIGVLDADGTRTSRRMIAELAANGTFTPRRYETRADIERGLRAGDVGVAVVIPPGLHRRGGPRVAAGQEATVEVEYDGAETILANNADGYLRGLLAATARDLDRAETIATPGPTGPAVTARALFNPRLDGKPFMVAGTFGWVLSFLTTLITAVTIVNERLNGTFEQLQVTPATSLEILLGKILPLGAVFAFDIVVMALIAGVFLGVWPNGSLLFFLGLSSLYVLVSLSIGLMISATSKTPAEAVQKSILLSIPLVILSGFVFPIRNMPAVVRWFAELFPFTHYIRVTRAIYLRGEGPLDVWPELAILLVVSVVLVGSALRSIEGRT